MKNQKTSDGRVFSDMRFLIKQSTSDASHVVGHTVATALLTLLSSFGDLLVILWFLYMMEQGTLRVEALVIAAAIVAMLRFITRYEQGVFARSRDRFRTRCGITLAEKALGISYADATDAAHLALLTRASRAIGRHIEAPIPHTWKTLSSLLTYVVAAVIYSAVLAQYHAGLWCITAFTALLGALVHRFVSDCGAREQDGEAACDTALAYVSKTAQSPRFSKDIRVFSLAPWLKAVYDSGFRAVQALSFRRAKVYALYNVAEALLLLLSNGFSYFVLVDAALRAQLPVSAVCLYVAVIGGLTWAVRGFFEESLTLKTACEELAVYRRFAESTETLDEDGERPESGVPHTVEVREVSFTHRGADDPMFEHLSFTWHRGEKLAVVADGNERSTLARLLCGLLDPDEGAVLIDGKDVRTLSRRAYYSLFSTVLQDTVLPDMTVCELVCQTDGAVDEQRLHECLVKAGASDAVDSLPRGVHTVIGCTAFEDGVELSGGQMQRLLLARALYKDGDLLMLDEPTAALDPLAEHALYRDYDRLTHGKSALFLSHRLAATRFCDRILVLKHGAVCEEGTHDELLKQGGDYARLFALQSRYYREGRDPS